jgi:YVTN family beta-propeller protein
VKECSGSKEKTVPRLTLTIAFAVLLAACEGPETAPQPSAAETAPEVEIVTVQKVGASVGFYTPAGELLATVPVGNHPHEMIKSPDGKLLYVSDNGVLWMTEDAQGWNTISIIDLESRTKVGVIDLGEYRRPHGLDIVPSTGYLVSTVENPDGLILIDPAARKVLRKYDTQGEAPHMVKLGPKAEWAYVSNTDTDTLAAIHLETGETKLIPVGDRPQGATLSLDGRLLYLTNSDSNNILILDTAKKEVVGEIATAAGPGRIAVTPDGSQLVYNLQAGEGVGFADIATGKQTGVVALEGPPLSLNLSDDGKLAYLGIQSLDKIVVVSVAEQRIVNVINTPKDSGPDPAFEVGLKR